MRFEAQTNIADHDDWAPRLSLSWAVGHSKGGPKTVLRAGYGIFYNRFGYANTLDAERYNGVNQQQYTVTNPDFFPTDAPAPGSLGGGLTSPTIYQVAPTLHAPYQMELGGSVERQLTNLPGDFNIRDFDISPDGREVVLERVQERSDIMLLDITRQ